MLTAALFVHNMNNYGEVQLPSPLPIFTPKLITSLLKNKCHDYYGSQS